MAMTQFLFHSEVERVSCIPLLSIIHINHTLTCRHILENIQKLLPSVFYQRKLDPDLLMMGFGELELINEPALPLIAFLTMIRSFVHHKLL